MVTSAKEERHRAILSIIREKAVGTQEELAAELRRAGFDVAQATISRDVRELRLIKVAGEDGTYRYAAPPDESVPGDALGRVQRAFRDFVIHVAFSGHLIFLKTTPGSAQVVAAALDSVEIDGVVGTVAGDDAILVVLSDGQSQPPPGRPTELFRMFRSWKEES